MLLRVHAGQDFEPAPAWLVSNGELTVGPVATHLLVRGFLDGRIPLDCQVRPDSGGEWRLLSEVREIRQARLGVDVPASDLATSRGAVRWLAGAADLEEAMLRGLHGACALTHASLGALYRIGSLLEAPVVSASYGDLPLEPGERLSAADPALLLAREGEPTALDPDSGAAARAMALRLAPARVVTGLAVVPMRSATDLGGIIELARFDHSFRAAEVRSLVPLMAATLARMEELSGLA
jgi:hypothetical protein